MTYGYTKLFSSLIGSTIWRQESKETKIVWITMLAMADKDGKVQASVPGLADFAKVSLTECEEAIEHLKATDPYSRTKDHEGRRIEECEGGWVILNHALYREKMREEERRNYLTHKQREYRVKKGKGPGSREQIACKARREGDDATADSVEEMV